MKGNKPSYPCKKCGYRTAKVTPLCRKLAVMLYEYGYPITRAETSYMELDTPEHYILILFDAEFEGVLPEIIFEELYDIGFETQYNADAEGHTSTWLMYNDSLFRHTEDPAQELKMLIRRLRAWARANENSGRNAVFILARYIN